MTVERTEGEPHDRLTRMGNRMLGTLEADPEYQEGDRCIVLLSDDEQAGTTLGGYEKDSEAIVDMFGHLAAVLKAHGKRLAVLPMGGGQG